MSSIQGMDVVAVRALAAKFARAGERFQQAVTEIDSRLTASWWLGPDADAFRQSWSARERPVLQRAATLLTATRAELLKQVREQELASQGGGSGPGPTGTPPVTTAVPLFGPFDEWARTTVDGWRGFVDDLAETAKEVGGEVVEWLDWLTGPKGPSFEDVTRLVPGLQQAIGDVLDFVMTTLKPVANWITDAFGFKYVPEGDYYTTDETSIQSHLGFHWIYDRVGKLGGMDLKEEVIEFKTADGREYKLELWKGGYGSGGAFGGEIGLYTRGRATTPLRGLLEVIPGYYSTAQGEDQIHMTQTIYNKHTNEVYFTNDGKGAADGDHYWNLAIRTDPGVRHEDLGQMGTLHVKDPQVREAMVAQMQVKGMNPVVNADGSVSYDWK